MRLGLLQQISHKPNEVKGKRLQCCRTVLLWQGCVGSDISVLSEEMDKTVCSYIGFQQGIYSHVRLKVLCCARAAQVFNKHQFTFGVWLPGSHWFPFSVAHMRWMMFLNSVHKYEWRSTAANEVRRLSAVRSSPLSATDNVLLKYCSSRAHELSFILLEIPHEPWQFTLMAVKIGQKQESIYCHCRAATNGCFHYLFICRLFSW